MARFFKYISILLFFLLFFPACQNEGSIGDLYGQWVLKKSSVNGAIIEHDQVYFSFQGKVVWVKRVDAQEHAYGDVFGSFEHLGDSLIMSFSQQNEFTSPASLIEEECRFCDANNIRLKIISLSEKVLNVSSGEDFWQFEKY